MFYGCCREVLNHFSFMAGPVRSKRNVTIIRRKIALLQRTSVVGTAMLLAGKGHALTGKKLNPVLESPEKGGQAGGPVDGEGEAILRQAPPRHRCRKVPLDGVLE